MLKYKRYLGGSESEKMAEQQQQSSAMLEGIELTAENVEAAVLQFYRSGATQVDLSLWPLEMFLHTLSRRRTNG